MKMGFALILSAAVLAGALHAGIAYGQQRETSVYANWENGPPKDPGYFPIGVWLQDPPRAGQYKEAGINIYIGLWNGPTEEQLAQLKAVGMQTICGQNEVGLRRRDERTIVAWMQPDEPDNAQSMEGFWKNDIAAIRKAWPDAPDRTLEQWGAYGPPMPPKQIVEAYQKMRTADSTRPIYMNFGQGLVYDYPGRHYRRSHPEDYAEYIKGADIVSFDIYPANNRRPAVQGKMWLPAEGTQLLRKWSDDTKIVWNIIECAHTTSSSTDKATPHEVRAQVWMALIRGSKGIVYIVHQFTPRFVEAGLLSPSPEDREMLKAITALNKQIHSLAPVLNSPTIENGASVESSEKSVPIDTMVKKHKGATYIFAAAVRKGQTHGTFQVLGSLGKAKAEVLGENRTISVTGGRFEDDFGVWDVHLYRITPG